MAKIFYRKQFSDYLGENRAILDVVVANVGTAPSPTPSITASPTPTPSITASLTPTPTAFQVCPEQFAISNFSGSPNNLNGTYNRKYDYSGGTFTYGYWSSTGGGAFIGTAPDGNNYPVFKLTSSNKFYARVFFGSTDRGFGGITAAGDPWYSPVGAIIEADYTGYTTISGIRFPLQGNIVSSPTPSRSFTLTYASPCPTPTPTQTITPTNTGTPTPTPTLPQGTSEAYAYLEAVVQAGGTVDATMSGATITFFQGLFTNNLWDPLYAFWPFMGGTNASHAVEGKLTYTMTWNGGITSSTDGIIGNGTNGYGNTGFNPDTVIGDGNTSSLGVYVTVLGAVGNRVYDAGANEGTLEQQLNIASRRVAGATNEVLFDAGNYYPNGDGRVTSTTTDGTGMTIGTARSDADRELYRNGTSIATQTNSRTLTYTARNIYFAAQNEGGSPNWYNSNTWGFFFIGKGLDDTEVSTLSDLINTYQTSLARNTY